MTLQACYDFAVPLSLCSECLRQTVFEEVPCALVLLQDVMEALCCKGPISGRQALAQALWLVKAQWHAASYS